MSTYCNVLNGLHSHVGGDVQHLARMNAEEGKCCRNMGRIIVMLLANSFCLKRVCSAMFVHGYLSHVLKSWYCVVYNMSVVLFFSFFLNRNRCEILFFLGIP